MEILVVGAGKVGTAVTKQLVSEGHNITIMDVKPSLLETSKLTYDVSTIVGNGGSMTSLADAEVENKELLIAVTNSDEVNLLACFTAKNINPNINCIARIRNPEYVDQAYWMREQYGLALVINPEKQAAHEIMQLLKLPGSLQRETFAKAHIEMVELKVEPGSRIDGVRLMDMEKIVKTKVLVCAVESGDTLTMPDGNYIIKGGDRIYVTANSSVQIHALLMSLGIIKKEIKNVLITGGGRIAYYLADALNNAKIHTHIIEIDRSKCENLAEKLPTSVIVNGDASSVEVLDRETLNVYDAVVSLTGTDESNIITSMYANMVGVPLTITKVGRGANVTIADALPIGPVVCPKDLCTDHIVSYVRAMMKTSGSELSVHTIARGKAEILEFEIDERTKYTDVALKDIKTRSDVLIVSITHNRVSEIASGSSKYEVGDTVVVVTDANNAFASINDIFVNGVN